MRDDIACSDCGGELELGFIPDVTYGNVWQSCWHRGDANEKKTFLQKLVSGGGVNYDEREMIAITVYRCSSCGLLKLYATPASES